jgi:hypothetical protein
MYLVLAFWRMPKDTSRDMEPTCDEVWYHGYQDSWAQQRGIGRPTMSRPTQPKDTGQEAHNLGSLEIIIDKSYTTIIDLNLPYKPYPP